MYKTKNQPKINTMKYPLIFLLLLAIPLQLFPQQPPKVTLKDSSDLKLSSLDITVEIIGNFASTTYDMKFYNELDRTLEGELAFPLGEGQSVSEFAMEVNGKLRKAVVVEKELARQAFENTVRQNIDPGLLEKTQGNNYKARVYPILPHSDKRIVLTYEQELFTTDSSQTFELPLGIEQNLDKLSVRFKIDGIHNAPSIEDSPYKKLSFKESNNSYEYEANFTQTNITPSSPILIKIPISTTAPKILTHNDYFYAPISLKADSKLKSHPKKIAIIWDASYSLRLRQLERELELLESYISYLQNIDIQFLSFSNDIHINKTFKIKEGDWNELKMLIKSIQYDGGTSLEALNSIEIRSDEILLLSDGIINLGDFSKSFSCPIYTFCSVISANHESLGNIAISSGGQFLNLQRLTNDQALDLLKKEPFKFLGFSPNKAISEVYPQKANVVDGLSISGRFSKDTNLELLFGYGEKVTEKIKIPVKRTQNSSLVKKLWAKQKLTFLNNDKEQNKEDIIAHSKQFQLVSDYTSMLILDRIEDYVRYRIEPPQELKREYKARIKEIEEREQSMTGELNYRKDEIFEDYKSIQKWYVTQYPKKELNSEKKNVTDAEQVPTQNNADQNPSNIPTPSIDENQTEITNTSNHNLLDTTNKIITGTVISGIDGLELPGANVVVKGTDRGVQTDFDGNYTITANTGDVLVFSFVSFKSAEVIVGTGNSINVSMQVDETTLDEVVVVAYGISRKESLTGSVSVVSHDFLRSTPGIQISDDISTSMANSNSANPTLKEPLFIVDGIISTTNPINSIETEEIETMQVLKAENASKLFGSRAGNGLIIITTKSGSKTNQIAIEELNRMIEEKIELKSWNPDTPYIDLLQNEPTTEYAYKKYLEIRDDYSNSPSFYLDVADFFNRMGSSEKAIRILTNLIEVKLDDHELMRALAYKLEYFKQYELAAHVYERILQLRPEDPQSFRDLALAYEQIGDIQKSFDILYKIYNGELLEKDEDERFYGIEHIAYVELSRLVNKYPKQLNLDGIKTEDFPQMPIDLRVVVDWNHNDTDIDLWVTDPNGEKAFYKNTETKIGGHLSKDMVEGYGPEEFMLKNAINGNYKVIVDYFSDNLQKISGPTILKATFFTNYGRKNEQKETLIFRLDKEEEEIEVGNIKIN